MSGLYGLLLFFLRISENLKQNVQKQTLVWCVLMCPPHLRLTTFAKGRLQEKCKFSLWPEKIFPKYVTLGKKKYP